MALAAGTRLGPHEILVPLGAGGMAAPTANPGATAIEARKKSPQPMGTQAMFRTRPTPRWIASAEPSSPREIAMVKRGGCP